MRISEKLRLKLRAYAHRLMASRPPDFIIRPHGHDQTLRWWVIPRNRFFNIYIHKWISSDEDRALHDHPWDNVSILLDGEYVEWIKDPNDSEKLRKKLEEAKRDGYLGVLHVPGNAPFRRKEGHIYFRAAGTAHRVELIEAVSGYAQVITLFITGPKRREWGFFCPKGWRHWKIFCDERDHGIMGRGCE